MTSITEMMEDKEYVQTSTKWRNNIITSLVWSCVGSQIKTAPKLSLSHNYFGLKLSEVNRLSTADLSYFNQDERI